MRIGRGCCFWLALALVGIVGCSSYPDEMSETKRGLTSPDRAASIDYKVYSTTGDNKLLAFLERGRLAQLQGDYKGSSDEYGQAISYCDSLEDKAQISMKDIGRTSAAVVTGNDLSMEYPVLLFERMMLHVLDGFNRLALGDQDGFSVNMRHLERCYGLGRDYLKQQSPQSSEEAHDGRAIVDPLASGSVRSYGDLQNNLERLSGDVALSADNVYALYLMALNRELRGDWDEALHYYGEIERLKPGCRAVCNGIDRCRRRGLGSDEGEVIVFIEEGFVPPKRVLPEKKTFGSGEPIYSWLAKIPTYSALDCVSYDHTGPLLLSCGDELVATGDVFCDVKALAVKSHAERLKGIFCRKKPTEYVTTAVVNVNNMVNGHFSFNPLVELFLLAGGLFTDCAASTLVACGGRPDLRSWSLLPRQVRMVRFPMACGAHKLLIRSAGNESEVSVSVKRGGLTLVHGTSIQGRLTCFSCELKK